MATNYIKSPDTIPEMRAVLNKWMDQLEQENNQEEIEDVCACLNGVLDDYMSEDAFGTEGQNDPRGDRR